MPPQITSYTSYIQNDTNDYFVVVGEVKNNLATAIESIQINATFYDAKNNTINTSSTFEEKSAVPVIEPGQKAPFTIRLALNSLTTIPNRCDLLLSYFKSSNEASAKFDILNQTSSLDNNGYYIISGWVQDVSPGKATGVSVICTFYDQEGNVTAVSRDYLQTWMFSGDEAPFRISSEPRKITPASNELMVVTLSYEPPLPQDILLLIILVAIFIIFIVYMKRKGW
jgi:hypothetical protein